ncbi:MAG: hypothetical protein R3C14_54365 [Caldilineaceae bacterium]
MTVRNGKGWIALRGGRVTATGETALQTKARAHVRRGKPTVCPYCGSGNISGGLGHWDCDDCGQGGSY